MSGTADEILNRIATLKEQWQEIERDKEKNNQRKIRYNKLVETQEIMKPYHAAWKLWKEEIATLQPEIIKEDARLKIESDKVKWKAMQIQKELSQIVMKIESNIGKEDMDQDEDELPENGNANYIAFMEGISKQIEPEETHEIDTIMRQERHEMAIQHHHGHRHWIPDVDPLAHLGVDQLIYNPDPEQELIEEYEEDGLQNESKIGALQVHRHQQQQFIPIPRPKRRKFKPPRKSWKKKMNKKIQTQQCKFIDLTEILQSQLTDDILKFLDIMEKEHIYSIIVQHQHEFMRNEYDGIIDQFNMEQRFNWFFMHELYECGFYKMDGNNQPIIFGKLYDIEYIEYGEIKSDETKKYLIKKTWRDQDIKHELDQSFLNLQKVEQDDKKLNVSITGCNSQLKGIYKELQFNATNMTFTFFINTMKELKKFYNDPKSHNNGVIWAGILKIVYEIDNKIIPCYYDFKMQTTR